MNQTGDAPLPGTAGAAGTAIPGSWSRDGRWLAYASARRDRGRPLERLWLAYASDRSGRFEVYVEAFPAGGQRVQVSGSGGTEPVWAHDGRTLFFVSSSRLMRVGVTEGPALALEKPVSMFDVGAYLAAATYGPAGYAVTPDGGSFYFVKPAALQPAPTRIHVVLNWYDEFARSLKR